jgi:hypothetical protein
MPVVMRDVLLQDRVQIPHPGDQHPVGDLSPHSDPTSRQEHHPVRRILAWNGRKNRLPLGRVPGPPRGLHRVQDAAGRAEITTLLGMAGWW